VEVRTVARKHNGTYKTESAAVQAATKLGVAFAYATYKGEHGYGWCALDSAMYEDVKKTGTDEGHAVTIIKVYRPGTQFFQG
jgi:hypothetical protein